MTTEITIHPLPDNSSPYQRTRGHAPTIENNEFFKSFGDLLDIFNPLQHIPGVSTIYQKLTGDTISQGAKMAGSVLFSGPIGLVGSLVNAIIEQETGQDLSGNLMATVADEYKNTEKLAS